MSRRAENNMLQYKHTDTDNKRTLRQEKSTQKNRI